MVHDTQSAQRAQSKEHNTSLSPTVRTRKQRNIPSRNNSNTNMTTHDKYQQEINELKEEIKLLKQYKKRQHELNSSQTTPTSHLLT